MPKLKKKLAKKNAHTKRTKESSVTLATENEQMSADPVAPVIDNEQANSANATPGVEIDQANVTAAIEGDPTPETSTTSAQESAASEIVPAPKHRGRKAKAETPTDAEPAPKRRMRKTNVEKPAAEHPGRRLARKEKTDVPEKAEETTVVQYGGQDFDVAELKERVISAYVEAGHRRGRISKLNIYIKPEDRKAYYVINDKVTGSIDF